MKRPLAVLLACAVALPALAQDADRDWDVLREPDKKLTAAFTLFDSGLGIATRCVDESYEVVIVGLPPAGADSDTRELRVAFGDDEPAAQLWNVAINDTTAVSSLPAPFARKLRQGGRLRITIPGGAEGGRNLLHDVVLPASSVSIDETLTVCDRPLVDPRDAELDALPDSGLPTNLVWATPPRPTYPSRARYGRGFAMVMCLTSPDGSLRECSVEAEHPQDGGFGAAALRGTRRARVANAESPTDPVPVAAVLFRNTFFIDGYQTPAERQALRARRPGER